MSGRSAAAGAVTRAAEPAQPRRELASTPPAFDFLESRTRVPVLREELVSRTALVNRLRATASSPLVSLVAPAGYGKTTLLAQWAARDERRFAWVTIDARDDDPVVLLRHVAAALERERPLPRRVIAALRAPGPSLWDEAVPRLAAALAARGPNVLVLDDFNLLRSRASLEVVSALVDAEATGSMLVVAGRVPPRLPIAPLRAAGRLLELGPADLAMSRREASLLLQATGVSLDEARVAELVERCEGWPAALYLSALSIRDGRRSKREAATPGGDDRYLADYFRSEYLSHLRPGPLRFLRRTSVLEHMSGPLCDAVLQDEGSALELEKIERANLFVVPLDGNRRWFRYHHLFRDLLRSELEEREPELVPRLHARAADWFESEGDDESALEHAYAAGDTERAAAILTRIALPVYYSGRVVTLERWLRRFERSGELERYPTVALHGCRIHMLRGNAAEAQRWLAAATRLRLKGKLPDGSASIAPWIASLRAWLCEKGAKHMLRDAEAAIAALPDDSNWRPSALLAKGAALTLLGEHDLADPILEAAAEAAGAAGAAESQVVALGERALVASEAGDHELADRLADDVRRLVTESRIEGYPGRAVELATTARRMLRHGRWNEARGALRAAEELLPFLTEAIPWLAVQVRLEVARGFLTLRDGDAAQRLLDEVHDLLRRVSGLATLTKQAAELQREIETMPEPQVAHHGGLTPAELRLLPLLASHLSFREIAGELCVSRNTIKTQAISVYRKLGVSSRSEAVAEAHRLGLGDHLRVVVTSER